MIGKKLKELRTQKGYTIVQLCQELKMNQNTYAKYERDERDVSTDTLSKLADFYGVSTDYLLGREKPAKPDILTMLTQEFHLTDLEKALVQAYIAISPKEREKFIQSIEETVKQKEESQQQAPKPEPPIVQSTPQNPPQPVKPPIVQQSNPPSTVEQPILTQQPPKIESTQSQWRFTARRTDGRYESRPATPEEVEKLKLMENDPEPEF